MPTLAEPTLLGLYHTLSICRRCADAGYFIVPPPISTVNAGATFMTIGQAPGRHEAEVTHTPFSGPAGRRLFRWLAQAGFDEADFRATQAMVAITRCYPGPHPAGRGDRVPTRAEQALCAPWLEAELALIQPKVLIPIGGLAIGRFLKSPPVMLNGVTAQPAIQQIASEASRPRSFAGDAPRLTLSGQPAQDDATRSLTMTGLIGHRFERDGRTIVPLPHPSGASQWFNVAENKERLARALEILGTLRQTLAKD
jgi:uracil-DNA glycosylase